MQALHEVYISGYGLLSCLPEDESAAWHVLNQAPQHLSSLINRTDFSPFFCHHLTNYQPELQIPNRGDRRFMGESMQAAAYSAGKALAMAGLTDNKALLQDTDVILCFSGGGRDDEIDQRIVRGISAEDNADQSFNEKLMKEIRPTLFLSQLPNLLAANIAIIHGVTGYSVTLMGEEMAGAQAIQLAYQRIQSGKAERVLVGSVHVNESLDPLAAFAQAKLLLAHEYLPVWAREQGGVCLGSASGFLVLESESAMRARQGHAVAKLSHVALHQNMQQNWQMGLAQQATDYLAVLSAVGGTAAQLVQEKQLWQQLQHTHAHGAIRGLATLMGTLLGATFPSYLIVAIACLKAQQLFAPLSNPCAIEQAYTGNALDKVWIHGQGQFAGHALMCVEAV